MDLLIDMKDTEMIIPPHSLHLTAIEEVRFSFKLKGSNGVKKRVKSPFSDSNELQNERDFEVSVEPNRQKSLTFGLRR